MDFLREFFGYGGYERTPEGAYSWQHLLFVACFTLFTAAIAVSLGVRNRRRDEKTKNRALVAAAILIDGFEILKYVIICTRDGSFAPMRVSLPLFLCSIQLITIPIAAFAKGRLKEASLDFVLMFGFLGGVAGIIGAAQNFNAYPVLSFDNTVSAVTHCISLFASIYIAVSGMISMKKKNIWIVVSILMSFVLAAFIANGILDYNYMFLRFHDGTPYFLFYNLVGGNSILYPVTVIAAFFLYMALCYAIRFAIARKKSQIKKG